MSGFLVGLAPSALDVAGVVDVAGKADRLGYAFAVGYAAAVNALVPGRGIAALAATENKSAHPRDVKTELAPDNTITGEKSFVTLGSIATRFLVVAREPALRADGRPQLRLVSALADATGITIEPLPPTPFAPELPHARVKFDHTPATLLEGDGYDRYLKPFRTVEDVYVHIALIAFLRGMAERDEWPEAFVARATAALEHARALVALDPSSPATHLALAESIDEARALAADVAFSPRHEAERAMWERDKPLLYVAERARTERLSRARAVNA